MTIGVIAIVVGAVKIFAKPAWLQVVTLILAALAGPNVVLFFLWRSRRKFVKKYASRMAKWEEQQDEERTSSSDYESTG